MVNSAAHSGLSELSTLSRGYASLTPAYGHVSPSGLLSFSPSNKMIVFNSMRPPELSNSLILINSIQISTFSMAHKRKFSNSLILEIESPNGTNEDE